VFSASAAFVSATACAVVSSSAAALLHPIRKIKQIVAANISFVIWERFIV
jgi:hypothetical protein